MNWLLQCTRTTLTSNTATLRLYSRGSGFVFLFSFLRLFNLPLELSNVDLILTPGICAGG